jgi:hypothetical protein
MQQWWNSDYQPTYLGSTALRWTFAAFQFLDFYKVHDSLDGGSARGKATTCTHRTAQTQNKRIKTSMP